MLKEQRREYKSQRCVGGAMGGYISEGFRSLPFVVRYLLTIAVCLLKESRQIEGYLDVEAMEEHYFVSSTCMMYTTFIYNNQE